MWVLVILILVPFILVVVGVLFHLPTNDPEAEWKERQYRKLLEK